MMKITIANLTSLGLLTMLVPGPVVADSAWDKPTAKISTPLKITVYRSPSCGCCGKWLDHLKKHDFVVNDVKTGDMRNIKKQFRVPEHLASCHTGIINGYVIEGHVPAGDIKDLLSKKPDLAGLTVPAMPSGTPGMEMGGRKDPFKVIAFDKDGNDKKYNEYHDY